MSKLAQTEITVYNSYTAGLPPFDSITRWERAFIKGVHWETDVDTELNANGKAFVDQTVLILIPKGVDQGGKIYISPGAYANLPADEKENHWTLTMDESNPTYIVLGEGRELNNLYTVNNLIRDNQVITVKGVSDMLSSPVRPHLEIRGV